MRRFCTGSTILFAAALPTQVAALDFHGAEIAATGTYTFPDTFPNPALLPVLPSGVDEEFTSLSLGIGAEIGLGEALFAQGDAVFHSYSMGWDDYKLGSIGGHLGYQVTPDMALGLFSYGELWDMPDEGDMSLGAEVTGRFGDVVFDGYGAYLFDPMNGTGWNQFHVEASAGYGFGNGVAVELGVHYASGDLRFGVEGHNLQGMANVSYAFADDFSVDLGYVYTDFNTDLWDSWQAHGVRLALTKTIGGGTTFASRSYHALHQGY